MNNLKFRFFGILAFLLLGACTSSKTLPENLSVIMDENRSVVIHSFVDSTICPAQEKSREFVLEDGIYLGKQVIECSEVEIVFSYLTDGTADHFEVKDMSTKQETPNSNGIFQVFSQYGQSKWTQWPIEETYAKNLIVMLLDESLETWKMDGNPKVEAISPFKEYLISY